MREPPFTQLKTPGHDAIDVRVSVEITDESTEYVWFEVTVVCRAQRGDPRWVGEQIVDVAPKVAEMVVRELTPEE